MNAILEKIDLCDLIRSSRNARTHDGRQIRQIADSIERFGFTNPVLIDENSTLIAGHGRFEAANMLGLKQIPAIRIAHLSEVENAR